MWTDNKVSWMFDVLHLVIYLKIFCVGKNLTLAFKIIFK